ncbi:hypothetical protein [Adhaeribacter soli]|uniref:Uncharacterized protein n=1 Tax=Adhaeribacter soli TaxID=2607655 RepID=A0A5N1J667_9BACT|nr:hypothetical protein [Adhaeribacter soli]KAA9345663.1 hypothetical protein F0P94_00825 [Adhaeribacter soli]
MKKFKLSTFNIFMVYLAFLLGYFVYAGFAGSRLLGDDKEEYEPEGVRTHSGNSHHYRSYHK